MTETNLVRIFKEKVTTKFKDKYTDVIYNVHELNIGFLYPTMQLNKDPESKEMKELEIWFERFEKIG